MIIPHSRPTINLDDVKRVCVVIKSGQLAQGEFTRKFEKAMAEYLGVKGGAAVSSGTAALHLGLIALGIKRQDEVILPTYVCSAVLNVVNYIGASAKICDINPFDFNISIREVKKKLSRRTKAIIVPHMFGVAADMDKLLEFGIPVIEDCVHSIGASYKNKKLGSWGKFCIISFYATKMLTSGEGGMFLSNSTALLEKVKDLRSYDEKKNYRVRYNYKMTDIEAALGLSQLSKLDSFIAKRKKLANNYSRSFSNCDMILPNVSLDKEHVFYRYVVRINRSLGKVIRDLNKRGVLCRRPVYQPLHRYLNLKNFPVAEKVWKSALSIPLYPSLSENEARIIIKTMKSYFK